MPISISVFCLLIFTLLMSLPAQANANMPPLVPASDQIAATELKLFHLDYKDVIAIAVETSLPAASIDGLPSDTLEPAYQIHRQDGLLEITLAARPALADLEGQTSFLQKFISPRLQQLTLAATSDNSLTIAAAYDSRTANAHITTVSRKQVKQADNTIIYRTYLVVSFSDKSSGTPPKTIVLDPGHGGPALGATSNFLLEKELNLDIALLSRDLFIQNGYDVYMTRTDDTNPGLLDRADAANILHADAFISVHNNSMPDDMPDEAKRLYRGTTALYNSSAPRPAKELAALIASQLADSLRIPQYPLQDRPGLAVLNSCWIPAVIAEVAMMPHPRDAKMLSQRAYRLEAAEAIVQATNKYFKIKRSAQPAAGPLPDLSVDNLTTPAAGSPLFYLDLTGDIYAGTSENIYRLDPGETTAALLSGDEAYHLNISGKYLYYSNWSDGHRLYRLSFDGTEESKMTNHPVRQVTIAGNWLVYSKPSNNRDTSNTIYKTSLDGNTTLKVNSDPSESLCVAGEWAYYLNAADNYRPYKIKLDGTGRTRLSEDQAIYLTAAGNTLYYTNYSDGQKLYAMDTSGQNRRKLTNDKAGFIAISSGNIYYTNASANHALYKRSESTGKHQLVCDMGAGLLPVAIINDFIYYNHLFFKS